MKKTTFLFWNINCVPPRDASKRSTWEQKNFPRFLGLIQSLVEDVQPDILVLAESTIPAEMLGHCLNGYYQTDDMSLRLKIWTRLPKGMIQLVSDQGKFAFRRVVLPDNRDLLFGAVHLSSKLHQDSEDQIVGTPRIRSYIEKAEAQVGHSRTIIFGDFNMNPFESGFVAADGLHAIMDRHIAEGKSRIVDEEERQFFYNPMWNHFGTLSPGPQGTYYYRSSRQITYFWNMFDQVILRPDLLSRFDDADTQILTYAETVPLVSRKRPFRPVQSDHLPLLFKIAN